MFKNHLKIAWRSLKKQPFFTFLNTFGLAIGMAGGLLISLYIYDELSYDTMFADSDQIYRVNADIKFGGDAHESAEVSAPMAAAMKNDFSQVKVTTRFRNIGSVLIKKSNAELNAKELQGTYADATFFEMFGIELLYGDVKTALTKPNTLVLTKSAAEKHFKLDEALGQLVVLENSETYTITGIMDDLPQNSFLKDRSVFMAMSGYEDAQAMEWTSHNYFTFVKLIKDTNIDDFNVLLESMIDKYIIPYAQAFYPGITKEQFIASGNYINYSIMPLTDIHLHSNRITELSPNSSMQNVYILSFIGVFLILLASVNFMNLSTAHSLKRAKEVGVRKTLGSSRFGLIKQFLTESAIISFISLVLSILLAVIALPFFNTLSGKTIAIPFTNPIFWFIVFLATVVLGIFSGSYPAFFMSKFIPVKVLKGSAGVSNGGGRIRNSLVIFQFAISVFLIVSTLVVFQQLEFIQNKDIGYTKDQVLIVNDAYAAGNQVTSFKEEVQKLGQVESVSLSGYLPTPSYRNNSSFFKDGSTEQENAINMQTWDVDHDYLNTLKIEIIAGRDFNKAFSADSSAIILNESAVAIMGLQPEEALGIRLSRELGSENPEFSKVIGVVKNFHFESLREDIGALSLNLSSSSGSMSVKLAPGNFSNTIANIENIWNRVAPGQPFSYRFLEDSFNDTYQAEKRLGRVFITFTILSILIACLGLFGLAAFNAEKRTKEIGVRKVLGASVSQISYRLTIDFLKLVGIAILVSLPLGWYAMNKWLEDFSYRIEIGWGVFATAAFLAIIISILTVSYQSIKAAIVNPIKSLRTE
ncbi:ABC transporter permease [Aquimarina sp. AD10]|uniref:FtsX-like permease family protein n=1 Tax=Aquimarina sp. AD10 TaxID=1714849 RepID=UPI000E4BF447|nr:FtsX-like permease family protein [Aquimarina sp. AD10]AXT61656.1 ABC transporter permease [Aquimarina sp. AD10]RKN00995.1 FtsX-like permease family protein [Aquimarina sp. AD10]